MMLHKNQIKVKQENYYINIFRYNQQMSLVLIVLLFDFAQVDVHIDT